MKLGIFTQPLHNNYGGLLQCFALQTVLKRMGHDAVVVRRDYAKPKDSLKSRIKNFIKFCLGYNSKYKRIGQYTQYFVNKYIQPQTPKIFSNEELKNCKLKYNFDGYVVGSDQVWRPRYSPCITNYFLDFVQNEVKCRVAYAASFGVDEWEFNEEVSRECSKLVKCFNAISVRESSGINLCREYLGVDATMVLDPTLLLERADYEALVVAENEVKSKGSLFCYVLDNSKEKSVIIDNIVNISGLIPFQCMPTLKPTLKNVKCNIESCIYPSVTRWLRSFMDAEMVITDSFHGCVFSIIFNKPFWVVGNEYRGMARFQSLLSIFGLESRLLNVNNLENIDWYAPIDWGKINLIKSEWQTSSMDFLVKNLK